MFEEDGNMRITKIKSALKRQLQVEQSTSALKQPDTVIIDGCAVLWTIHGSSQGTVQDYVSGCGGTFCVRSLSAMFTWSLTNTMIKVSRVWQGLPVQLSRPADMTGWEQIPLSLLSILHCHWQQGPDHRHHLSAAVGKVPGTSTWLAVCNSNLPSPGPTLSQVKLTRAYTFWLNAMRTSHEEADVIIDQQMVHTAQQGSHCTKVTSDDTDVHCSPVILRLNTTRFQIQRGQVMDPKLFSKNHRGAWQT